ncbi:MAG: GNAT family acetyltransferase [Anaerolineales bacterium]|nr:GNAT family acetyltransferase [Anaerolineales bacterium]
MRLEIRPYKRTDEREVIGLWRTVFPNAPAHNDPGDDIRSKLRIQPELFFVALADGRIVGSAMSGFDGHRGWVYYVAVHPEYRRLGIGSALMEKVEASLIEIGCPKLNLQIRADNADVQSFYASLGYRVEERISMGKRLGDIDA